MAQACRRLYLEQLSGPPSPPTPLCSELDEEGTLLSCDEVSSSPCISAKLLGPAQSRAGGGLLIDRIRRCLNGGRDLYPPHGSGGREGGNGLWRGAGAARLPASDVAKERAKDKQRYCNFCIDTCAPSRCVICGDVWDVRVCRSRVTSLILGSLVEELINYIKKNLKNMIK